ncbi:Retrovirus-related Pol polyprotein from type-1 retrotransposable element R2 [Amphibalanus amphitrite]|uniref:Retrovirus-related Pol polyprotein from type-1 retrotransposable element R2 n=1 Tax=Amphibalanus amphitrite TaxID=1232801 RepID=A0A6A4WEJ5_AMPAM|nr:Retrovirus-related Pol polyprotein from type-1 retrotransposable element R2 [Amphibalanus amphitrite]
MLQHRIRIFAETLAPTGLKPNAAKCHSLTIKVDGKHKKTVVDNNAKYTIAGQPIPTMGPTDSIKYLGVEISASGVLMSAGKRLHKQLTETDRAPLKPQQRLFILKRHIIPGMTHTLVLGKTNITKLKAMDITIRTMTRKWLHIPKDTPVGFFHAALEDGGLDIPALVDTIPRLVKNRLAKLNDSDHPNIKLVTQSGYLSHRGGVASGAMTADENRRKRAQQLLSSLEPATDNDLPDHPTAPENEPQTKDPEIAWRNRMTRHLAQQAHHLAELGQKWRADLICQALSLLHPDNPEDTSHYTAINNIMAEHAEAIKPKSKQRLES